MTRRNNCKAAFTLIEIFIVVAIIGLASGFLSINIKNSLAKQHFLTSHDLLIEKMQLAQEIALDYDSDVVLDLHLTDQGLNCQLSIFGNLPPKIIRMINDNLYLKEITALEWEHISTRNLRLYFNSNQLGSQGELELQGKLEKATIYLPGYPAKIAKKNNGLPNEKAPYPQEIEILAQK